jgi:hypothetical protein
MAKLINFIKKVVKFCVNYENYRDSAVKRFIYDVAGKIGPVIAVNCKGIRLFVPTKDRFLGRNIFIQGPQELDKLQKIAAVLKREGKAVNRPIFIDIGANIGSASICALLKCKFEKAIAFEPAPANCNTPQFLDQ